MKTLSSEEGFTLSEIICFFVIFSIFAAVAIPRVINMGNSVKAVVCKQNQNAIKMACAEYLLDEKDHSTYGYPERISDLVPKYLEEEPVCPLKGSYRYDPDDGSVSCSEPGHGLGFASEPETTGGNQESKSQDPE